jgi:hypothetical protein
MAINSNRFSRIPGDTARRYMDTTTGQAVSRRQATQQSIGTSLEKRAASNKAPSPPPSPPSSGNPKVGLFTPPSSMTKGQRAREFRTNAADAYGRANGLSRAQARKSSDFKSAMKEAQKGLKRMDKLDQMERIGSKKRMNAKQKGEMEKLKGSLGESFRQLGLKASDDMSALGGTPSAEDEDEQSQSELGPETESSEAA